MKKTEFQISIEEAGKRVDVQTSELSGITRSQVHHLIEKGLVQINHLPTKPNYKTKYGDTISITIPDEDRTLAPENIPLEILYSDDFLIVVNKPPDMVIYPAAGHSSGTLLNAIAYHSKKLASVGGPLRPGVVHRLDKDTSGVMVVALDDSAYYNLVGQFKQRSINRKYKALIYGTLKTVSGEIVLKIGRSSSDRKKMSTKVRKGKEAVTTWRVIESLTDATLIEAKLLTGRTHQIRVHFASIGHPVLGDKTYGKKTSIERGSGKILFPRQMLHAELLGFTHPTTGEYMEFRSEIPQDMREKIVLLKNNTRG
ncbi:MAG: RNA pseudouridine synthase [Nitrospira bacterium HGW-Nitrospira-1]|nr:MAG: RNA pseudouridine synthase [Nitrospira bacterium HGW-Nitrospira-1]